MNDTFKAIKKVKIAQQYAVDNFHNGLSCSESTYEALLRAGAVSEKDAPYFTCAMCAGFGGGTGLSGNNCGALSGAVMAVGAKHGRKDPRNDKPDGLYDREYHRYNLLVEEFKAENGSPLCKEICKNYIGTWNSEERKAHCTQVIKGAVAIACKYLDMPEENIINAPWGYNVTTDQLTK